MTTHPQWRLNRQSVKQAFQQFQPPGNILTKPMRIRPWDGGLNTEDPSDTLDPKKTPSCRDIFIYRGELRKSFGSVQIGTDFPTTVLWSGVWERQDGSLLPIAITTENLFYYNASTLAWTLVTGGGGFVAFTVSGLERFIVQLWDDIMYFASDNNPLRSWNGDGASTHNAVAGGFTARGMTVLSNHLVLVAPRSGATLEAQTIRFTQSGSPAFTGAGSGSIDLADREDVIQNIAPLGPYRGVTYKANSIAEIRATGDALAPFEQTEIIPGLGLLCAYSLIEWAGGHLFVADDEQIYNYSGSNLDAIGTEIVSDLFANLDHTRLRDVIAGFDHVHKEYIVLLPDSGIAGQCDQYFAYNVLKRRWRSGRYKGTTHINAARSTVIVAGGVVPLTRYQLLVGTTSKRVLRLSDTAAASFDGTSLQFEIHTADFIGSEDGREITIDTVRIGYVVEAATSSLLVDASIDGGLTWNAATTLTLNTGFILGNVRYARATFPSVTGQQIRIRLRNSTPGQTLRIRSITPVPIMSEENRESAQ